MPDPDKGTFQVVVHGKVVKDPLGPIMSGAGYSWIGRSEDVSDEILELCTPEKIGIRGDEQLSWNEYPWKRRGGIVVQPVFADGRWRYIAGRIRPRSENGEGQPGRLFTQANYLIGDAEHSSNPLLEIPDDFAAEPLTRIDLQIERVKPQSRLNDALRPNWFSVLVRGCVKRIVSNRRVAIIGEEISPDEFLELARLVMCCLPRAIRWQFSVGGGFFRVPTDIDLGHGLAAEPGCLQCIDGAWERDSGSLDDGDAYVRWLEEVVVEELANCEEHERTFGALEQTIHSEFDAFGRWDYPKQPDPGLPLPQRNLWAPEFTQQVRESDDLRRLERWLDHHPVAMPPLSGFVYLRDRLIVAVLLATAREKSAGQASRLLHEFEDKANGQDEGRTSWRDDLKKAIVNHEPDNEETRESRILRAYQIVFGWQNASPQGLSPLYRVPLPDFLHSGLKQNIRSLLKHVQHGQFPSWRQFLLEVGDEDAVNWLVAVRGDLDSQFTWMAFCLLVDYRQNCVHHWSDRGACGALADIIRGNAPKPKSLEQLFRCVDGWPIGRIKTLVGLADKIRPLTASLILAEAVSRKAKDPAFVNQLIDRLAPQGSRQENEHMVVEVGQDAKQHHLHESPFRYVLLHARHLTQRGRQIVGDSIGDFFGDDMAGIFFGVRRSRGNDAKYCELARNLLPYSLTWSDSVAWQTFCFCAAHPEKLPEVEEMLLDFLAAPPAEGITVPPQLRFVTQRLSYSTMEYLPDFTVSEALFVTRLLSEIVLRPFPPQDYVFQRIGELRAYVATVRKHYDLPFVSDALMAEVIERIADDETERRFWTKRLRSLGGARRSRWRLFLRQWHWRVLWRTILRRPLSRKLLGGEEGIVARLSMKTRMSLLCEGWKIDDPMLPAPGQIGELASQGTDLQKLLRVANAQQMPGLARRILQYLLDSIGERGQGHLDDFAQALQATRSQRRSEWYRTLTHDRTVRLAIDAARLAEKDDGFNLDQAIKAASHQRPANQTGNPNPPQK